jgi:hypothetical protein
MLAEDGLVDTFIEQQSRAMLWHLVFALSLAMLGLLLLLVAFILPDQVESSPLNRQLLSASGAFISTLCAFPIRDLLARKEKADVLRFLKSRLSNLHTAQDEQVERDRIHELLWKTLNKVLER